MTFATKIQLLDYLGPEETCNYVKKLNECTASTIK